MGGKRPDQYRIDPDEGRTTDYKFLPDSPGERRRDYQRFGNVMKPARRSQPVPPAAPEPDAERDRAEEMERQEQIREADSE